MVKSVNPSHSKRVLATDNAVIPYAVGVDIACRMRLSVFDIPAKDLRRLNDQLVRTLQNETKFGTGAAFQKPLDHEVLGEDWSVTSVDRLLPLGSEAVTVSKHGPPPVMALPAGMVAAHLMPPSYVKRMAC